mmetsp:Transcript_3550/g.9341  ORF Transcript_3550/g.9341 Transcript_3550/m.9341 type:complete len:125 (+) Transcript_3550:261-635(+)|eukprot:2879453-Prymnesium_polylepis.1
MGRLARMAQGPRAEPASARIECVAPPGSHIGGNVLQVTEEGHTDVQLCVRCVIGGSQRGHTRACCIQSDSASRARAERDREPSRVGVHVAESHFPLRLPRLLPWGVYGCIASLFLFACVRDDVQ